jgi:N6-L-threonylcarbamoyladenine synthase
LERSERDVSEIGLLVVGRGPGSYTGVRIGLAAAKGMAQGLGIGLLGVGTLDAVAWRLRGVVSGLVGVVGDAMRGEVYPALFEIGDDVTRLEKDRVETPEVTAARWAEETDGALYLVGDGLSKHVDLLTAALGHRATIGPREQWLPTGAGVLAAGLAAGVAQSRGCGEVLPVYTRLSDAEHRESADLSSVPESGVAGPGGGARPQGTSNGRGEA